MCYSRMGPHFPVKAALLPWDKGRAHGPLPVFPGLPGRSPLEQTPAVLPRIPALAPPSREDPQDSFSPASGQSLGGELSPPCLQAEPGFPPLFRNMLHTQLSALAICGLSVLCAPRSRKPHPIRPTILRSPWITWNSVGKEGGGEGQERIRQEGGKPGSPAQRHGHQRQMTAGSTPEGGDTREVPRGSLQPQLPFAPSPLHI